MSADDEGYRGPATLVVGGETFRITGTGHRRSRSTPPPPESD